MAGLFLALCLWRITMPPDFYFDEVHYVPAARKLLDLVPANREHPMFGKEVIAAAIHLLGDKPFAWRVGPALFGALGLFAFTRMVWFLSLRRRATLIAGLLLATNFMWFVQSRIAMLDMIEAGLCMVGLWQFVAALRSRSTLGVARTRLILCGVALGLSLGAKWSSAPALMMPGLAFLALRIRHSGLMIVGRRGAGPIPGISLVEATLWLGLLPLAVYWLTYLPAMFYTDRPITPFGFVEQHQYMIRLQDSVKKLHPYRSVWYQWVADWRAIWFLFKEVDGYQRGIIMLGNPFSMLTGLLALPWAIWAVAANKRRDALALLGLYTVCLGVWAINGKPIQFYYHYLLPGAFLMGLLALAADALLERRGKLRWAGKAIVVLPVVMFIGFYPIISAVPLPYKDFYNVWIWLPTWR